MFVSRLSLIDFRNYETLDLDLQPGSNLFVGSNGQGKTNLVEAIVYLSTLGSHRVAGDKALIRQGQDAAIVRARLRNGERETLLEVQINRAGVNRAQVNRSPIKPRDLPQYCASVLFAPEDLALVRGEPSGRRRFMDELLVLRTPRLTAVLADYDRALRQRNTLLKSARGLGGQRLSTLELWDERLVGLGSQIIEARSRLVAELEPEVSRAYQALAGADHAPSLKSRLSVFGANSDDENPGEPHGGIVTTDVAAEAFRATLTRTRRAELDRGLTLAGPHLDDLTLELNGLPARGYASHGESWSFALALKLASAAVLRRESLAGDPVLVLDDVFAELDESRRSRLAQAVADFDQVLITAAVYDDVPASLAHHTVRIRAGRVVVDDA